MHHGSEVLLLPNAWDAISARLFAKRGFRAIATTSGGVAWALGYGDGEQVPLAEVLALVRRIVRAVDLPVTVDFETGYGPTATDVANSIRAVIETGAAGVNLEDSEPGHGPMRGVKEAAARIQAARDAATATGVPLVINARVDNWLHHATDPASSLEDATHRARAYVAAGADCIYPIGLRDFKTTETFVKAVHAPVNVMGGPGTAPLSELARIGVARVSTATWFAALALGAIDRAAGRILQTGHFDALATDFNYLDAQRLSTDN
jgi:2-methylisocitrate lyase-like PEP mutase family enzyme